MGIPGWHRNIWFICMTLTVDLGSEVSKVLMNYNIALWQARCNMISCLTSSWATKCNSSNVLITDDQYCFSCISISWGRQLADYPSARVPHGHPYILDPANPFNNMYLSGVGPYQPGRHFSEYAPGNGKWGPFAEKVHSLELCA